MTAAELTLLVGEVLDCSGAFAVLEAELERCRQQNQMLKATAILKRYKR